MKKPVVTVEDLLYIIDDEDLAWAIEYLKKREKEWQDWLSTT